MRRVFLALLALAALASPCWAQSTQVCSGFDTINVGDTTAREVLQVCNVTTGPMGIIYATATAEVTCGGTTTESAQMHVGTGTSPVNGSNFLGSASGGTLTVSSLIPGFGATPWTIQSGQLLVPGSGATPFTPTAITGQTGGTTGGVGTYTIANGALSITAGTNLYTLNATPGGVTNITPVMQQTACNAGFTITTIAGAFTGLPHTQYWIGVSIATNTSGSQAEWNNNGITVLTY